MTISVFDTSNTDVVSDDSTLVDLPNNLAVGDLLLVAYCVDDTLVSTPSGWTVALSESNSTTNAVLLWKESDGTETSVTLDWSGTDADGYVSVVVLRPSLDILVPPFRQSSKNEALATDTLALTGLTGVASDSMMVAVLFGYDAGLFSVTPPTGYTEISDGRYDDGALWRGIEFCYKQSPSSSESPSATWSRTMAWISGFLLEIGEGVRGNAFFFGTNH